MAAVSSNVMSWVEDKDTFTVMSLNILSTRVVLRQSALTYNLKVVDISFTPDASDGWGIVAVTVIV
jgi:hypothetical protein